MLNILVVDDSIIIRKSLIKIFSTLGFNVVGEAANGFEAVDMFSELSPDFVTLDITMPEKNGVEALEDIININDKAVVAMVTSHGEEELVMNSVKIGAKGYILKPITKSKVAELINKTLI